jgi:hypothetical protein
MLLGSKHSVVTKKKMRLAAIGRVVRTPLIGSWSVEYKGTWFKSDWERRFAQWCDEKELKWKYECFVFKLNDGHYYVPDFELPDVGCFVEVKGRYFGMNKMDEFVGAGYDLRIIDKENINAIHLEKRWKRMEG